MRFYAFWLTLTIVSLLVGSTGCGGVELAPVNPVPPTQQATKSLPPPLTATNTPVETVIRTAPDSLPANTPTYRPPTPCPRLVCTLTSQFPLARPIALPDRDTVEPSYRFGSTQDGKREPHHGVEFINKAGTPVLAAADGIVVAAGDDLSTAYGPMVDFYGKLVIIEHYIPGIVVPIYTLYGHLLQVGVSVGQRVQQSQLIGEVGLGGVAAGTHLHFEVRYGENDYNAVRNPELWLQPHQDEQGQPQGVLAGRIVDDQGELLSAENIVVKQLDDCDKITRNYYLMTYENPVMLAQAPWYDSFALGDLPAGMYQISFIYKHEQKYKVQVLPGVVTYVYLRGE